MLKIFVHADIGTLPATQASIRIEIPDPLAVERSEPAAITGWDSPDPLAGRTFGDQSLSEQRTAVLLVPSVVLFGNECNILFSSIHPDF